MSSPIPVNVLGSVVSDNDGNGRLSFSMVWFHLYYKIFSRSLWSPYRLIGIFLSRLPPHLASPNRRTHNFFYSAFQVRLYTSLFCSICQQQVRRFTCPYYPTSSAAISQMKIHVCKSESLSHHGSDIRGAQSPEPFWKVCFSIVISYLFTFENI